MIDFIEPDRKDLIRLFMSEAKKHVSGLKKGFAQDYENAMGLVNVAIAFESFIYVLPADKNASSKQVFSIKYKAVFEKLYEGLKPDIIALKKELDEKPLYNMKIGNGDKPYKIIDPKDLLRIVQVFYRVRSNLVHGNKIVSSPRNKLLISNSFKFMYKLLDNILREEKIIN